MININNVLEDRNNKLDSKFEKSKIGNSIMAIAFNVENLIETDYMTMFVIETVDNQYYVFIKERYFDKDDIIDSTYDSIINTITEMDSNNIDMSRKLLFFAINKEKIDDYLKSSICI